MAMIRSNASVFNKPIGVIRSDVGGAQIGNAIARVADGFANRAYKQAAVEAEEAGTKAAASRASSSIVAINPETGLPEAYQAPTEFGSIAARAYQNMIDRRFEDSINEEIKVRAQEVAREGGGSEQFKTRMTNYVEQMYVNAVGEDGELNAYGRTIQENGTAYVASTYNALRNKEAAAAKAALKRANELAQWTADRELSALVRSGADIELVAGQIEDQRARALDAYTAGGSLSTYKKTIEATEGYAAIAATGQLSNMYLNLSETDKNKFKVALMQPSKLRDVAAQMGSPEIASLAHMALATSSPAQLISAFDSLSSAEDEFNESVVEVALSDYPITSQTTDVEIRQNALQIEDVDSRNAYIAEANLQLVMSIAGNELDDVDKLDATLNQLRRFEGTDRATLSAAVGDRAADVIQGMDYETRSELADALDDRRSALNAVGNIEEKGLVNTFGEQARSISGSNDPFDDLLSLKGRLNLSVLDAAKKNELEGRAENIAVDRGIFLSNRLDVDLAELNSVRALVQARAEGAEGLSEKGTQLFNLYSSMYDLQESTVNGEMERRINGLTELSKGLGNQVRLDAAISSAQNGNPIGKDDERLIDEKVLANVTTAAELASSEVARSMMERGVFTKKMVNLLSGGINSTNEQIVEAATGIFEQYSRVQQITSRGEAVESDYMRRVLPRQVYAQYAAASYAKAKLGMSPAAALNAISNYDGGLDAIDSVLRGKSVLDVPDNKPLSSALKVYNMSPQYELEVISMLRLMEATGQNVTTETVTSWISDYESKALKDPSVVGYRVGDETVYAMRNFFSVDEMNDQINQITNIISEDVSLQGLLTGGTTADQALATVRDTFLPDLFGMSAGIADRFTKGWQNSAEQNNKARLRAGLEAINFDLKFKPNVAAHESGVPTWYVGYKNNGVFEIIEINDQPLTIQKINQLSIFATTAEDTARSSAYNELIAAQNSPTAGGAAVAERGVRYFATLEHMTEELFVSSSSFKTANNALNGRALEIFREARGSEQ